MTSHRQPGRNIIILFRTHELSFFFFLHLSLTWLKILSACHHGGQRADKVQRFAQGHFDRCEPVRSPWDQTDILDMAVMKQLLSPLSWVTVSPVSDRLYSIFHSTLEHFTCEVSKKFLGKWIHMLVLDILGVVLTCVVHISNLQL